MSLGRPAFDFIADNILSAVLPRLDTDLVTFCTCVI